jgi:hypothetical protein
MELNRLIPELGAYLSRYSTKDNSFWLTEQVLSTEGLGVRRSRAAGTAKGREIQVYSLHTATPLSSCGGEGLGERRAYSRPTPDADLTSENGLLSLIPSPPQEERETKNGTL